MVSKIDALRKRGPRTDCGKCLRSFLLDDDITDDQWRRGVCSRCWKEENERRKDQDEQRTKTGGESSPESYELSEIPGSVEIRRHAKIIGLRNDVVWHKKAGGNGDG